MNRGDRLTVGETLLAWGLGALIGMLFVSGLWYCGAFNVHAPLPAPTESVTYPVLEATPIRWSTETIPEPVFRVNGNCAILFASGIRISPDGKVTIPPGVDVDASTRLFWDSIERTCPRRLP